MFSPDLPLVVSIHKQIRDAIMLNDIPDVRLPPLISLMVACGLTKYILKPEEAGRFKKKVVWLAGMKSLGREIIHSVHDLETADLDKDAAALIGLTAETGELLLMTVRSHDQFNTFIFGLNDRYRGINNERRVLFMNHEDVAKRNIAPEQMVEIASHYDNQLRKQPKLLLHFINTPQYSKLLCSAYELTGAIISLISV